MNLVSKHFKETERLVRAIDKNKIADWLLNEGYFPEQYVLPPTFKVNNFKLRKRTYNKDINDLVRRNLISISYPKSLLTSRVFGIQHPFNYHDIILYLYNDWDHVLDILFQKDLQIFSYSFPIPLNARKVGEMNDLRSGRMIYEWIEMAEKDIISEAYKYNFIVRADITNFYSSIYTHSIGWSLHGRENSFADKNNDLTGNKIDRLVQYANDGRTNGIPVGSALSDLIAEIVLTSVDVEVSRKLKDYNLIGCRFKDDYRILCNSEDDAKTILKILSDELLKYNLSVNEQKTQILSLPHGLYRQHDREYHSFSLKERKNIPFKTFELTLLKALDIHKLFPGTSILEKFLSEVYDDKMNLKVKFSNDSSSRKKQLLKLLSLLMLLKRESEKTICHVLALCEIIYNEYWSKSLKKEMISVIETEIEKANKKQSVFEIVWLIFFSRYLKLGIRNFNEKIDKQISDNQFVKSIISSSQKIFQDSGIILFRKPKECISTSLSKELSVFNRSQEE